MALAQTTRIVCNIPTYNNSVTNSVIYTNLQTCIDASSAGDIIIVQGSSTSYGNIVVAKPLILLGPGYFLVQNPNTQAQFNIATLGSVQFNSGSIGSLLKGFVVSSSISLTTTSVIIQNNSCNSSIYLTNTNNCIIKQNYCNGIYANVSPYTNNSNLMIQNNILLSDVYTSTATITNNFFNGVSSYWIFTGCLIKNNIFAASGLSTTPTNNAFLNNIITNNTFGTGSTNGNVIVANIDNVFLGYPTQGAYSFDGRYQLKSGSPAISAGDDNLDCGPFGGSEPYRLSGIGFNPNIYSVTMPSSGTSQGGLSVRVLISANQ